MEKSEVFPRTSRKYQSQSLQLNSTECLSTELTGKMYWLLTYLRIFDQFSILSEEWMKDYNQNPPHEALGEITPVPFDQ